MCAMPPILNMAMNDVRRRLHEIAHRVLAVRERIRSEKDPETLLLTCSLISQCMAFGAAQSVVCARLGWERYTPEAKAVMDAGELPAVLYNVPGRTAVGIAPETVAELAEDDRVVGIKEACGDLSQIAILAHLVGDRITLWSGNDDQILPILSLGGLGVISVLGNVAPADTSRMVHAYLEGDTAEATALQLKYIPLIKELFAVANPIPVKALVGWLGFDVGPVRLPLVPLTDAERKRLIAAAEAAGLEPRR